MRYLASTLGSWARSITLNGSIFFSKKRSTLEHRLLSMMIGKPRAEMWNLDWILEACRTSSLIFVNCVLHQFEPVYAILQDQKQQLLALAAESEGNVFQNLSPLRRGTVTWILFMAGILSLPVPKMDCSLNV
ncbi:hypothetical protein N7G274_009014 [Stereocaulon virgatum]|uniref:Uncharacterized protein n=1 Tax=Stereocaulon virgatum TaxID=373712 RepID=A0ABR3ZYR2_9LECA